MKLTGEQQKELARFPTELLALVEAELAAGNSICEVGHSHPAPPAGAYFKLARKVSTRARVAGGGLTFRERNSSISSGEFGDASGFFFVVEPADPPPPEVDMDAIRRSLEPRVDSLARLAARRAGEFGIEFRVRESAGTRREGVNVGGGIDEDDAVRVKAFVAIEKHAGVRHELRCCDVRRPEQMQEAMEREFGVLFEREMESGVLVYRAKGNVNGARYEFEMRFLGVEGKKYYYSVVSDASWGHQAKAHHEYYSKVSESWFEMWTRELKQGVMKGAEGESTNGYREACERAMVFETELDSVEAIQREVVARIKRGGRYSTSHKEGGTNIVWRGGAFVRSDYGDYPDHVTYKDEPEFLAKLRMFLQWEVARNSEGQKISEFEAWKLILRRMSRD